MQNQLEATVWLTLEWHNVLGSGSVLEMAAQKIGGGRQLRCPFTSI